MDFDKSDLFAPDGTRGLGVTTTNRSISYRVDEATGDLLMRVGRLADDARLVEAAHGESRRLEEALSTHMDGVSSCLKDAVWSAHDDACGLIGSHDRMEDGRYLSLRAYLIVDTLLTVITLAAVLALGACL